MSRNINKGSAKLRVVRSTDEVPEHSTDSIEISFDIIAEARNLKKMANEDDFDQNDYQDRLWRIADRIQQLAEAIEN